MSSNLTRFNLQELVEVVHRFFPTRATRPPFTPLVKYRLPAVIEADTPCRYSLSLSKFHPTTSRVHVCSAFGSAFILSSSSFFFIRFLSSLLILSFSSFFRDSSGWSSHLNPFEHLGHLDASSFLSKGCFAVVVVVAAASRCGKPPFSSELRKTPPPTPPRCCFCGCGGFSCVCSSASQHPSMLKNALKSLRPFVTTRPAFLPVSERRRFGMIDAFLRRRRRRRRIVETVAPDALTANETRRH